jgi:hypothetical protein
MRMQMRYWSQNTKETFQMAKKNPSPRRSDRKTQLADVDRAVLLGPVSETALVGEK